MPPVAPLAIGDVVAGRFRLEGVLGSGGMGTVYRATQMNLDREVALKLVAPELVAQEGTRDRFEREARVNSQLRHPNAVEIYDYGQDGDQLFIAMEMLRGCTLRDLVDVDRPAMAVARAVPIAERIADVLMSADSLGLVHRDLKPENIFLDRSDEDVERVVVVDFGLAFVTDSEKLGRMTREGVIAGTPDYMAPEQAAGANVDSRADVYALGCLLYEMLTSTAPFIGPPVIVMARHMYMPPTSMRDSRPDLFVAGALDDIVMRMLAKDPEERPSARAVRDFLRRFDPKAVQRMGKGSGGRVAGRAARMISQAPTTVGPAVVFEGGVDVTMPTVAVHGEVSSELEFELAACGLSTRVVEGEAPAAVFAPGASAGRLAELVEAGVPVVTDAALGDVQRLATLLRAGVAEVVMSPHSNDELARKLLRAIRRSPGRKKS